MYPPNTIIIQDFKMPAVTRNASPSSQSSFDGLHNSDTSPSSAASSAGDDEYAAASFPDYAEKPLDEQLEPIAVVGMGMYYS